MTIIKGTGVCGGIVFGKLVFDHWEKQEVIRRGACAPGQELERFLQAQKKACAELDALYETALRDVGEEEAAILQIHRMMVEDLDYCEFITKAITQQNVNAEYAVSMAGKHFAHLFSQIEDPYLRGRAADVKDVSERLIRVFSGAKQDTAELLEPAVLAAEDFAPSRTIQFDKAKILAFVTRGGSAHSHTAILARTLNIPAIIGAGDDLSEKYAGNSVIVDGSEGLLYLSPDEQTIERLREKQRLENERRALLTRMRDRESITLDGQRVAVAANIGGTFDLDALRECGADGVGLFRSEFLFLGRPAPPDEEEQFFAYRAAVKAAEGRKVIIRTLDIGADKQVDYLGLKGEENPALGLRGIRVCLERPELLRMQLRAVYRASAFGSLAVMFPMIASVWEVREARRIAAEVRAMLRVEGLPFSESVELGVMIETPAAAILSGELAREADFFSIGTNDLTQYTLAADRQNRGVERYYNARHPAVLRLIQAVTENAHQNGIWVGICGELAAEPDLTEWFLAIGVDELSVSPSFVLELRERVCGADAGAARLKLLQGRED